jgi:hypothetical protein
LLRISTLLGDLAAALKTKYSIQRILRAGGKITQPGLEKSLGSWEVAVPRESARQSTCCSGANGVS